MNRALRLLPTLLVVLVAGCASREAGPPPGAGFAALDADADGLIEQPEFVEAFSRFDLDGDGTIDAQENAAIVYEADGNRDGRVTPEEFRTIDLARLEADADLDGRISRAELERFEAANRRAFSIEQPVTGETYARQRPEVRWVRFRF